MSPQPPLSCGINSTHLGSNQTDLWSDGRLTLDPHRTGWLVAGGCAVLTCAVTAWNVVGHCRWYRNPLEQRQIIRILLMSPVYAVLSWASYRWYHYYLYFEMARDMYEALAVAAFMILMLLYVGQTTDEQRDMIARKEKQSIHFPFCCVRYRPSKPYFLWAVKWSVLQFVIVGPAIGIAGIITEAFGVYCAETFSPRYAHAWLAAVDFITVSVALEGLLIFHSLAHSDLVGRRAINKFFSLKAAIFFTFYQSFVFDLLAHYGIIKATEYWSVDDIENGLNALCTCVEMVFIAIWQCFAFPYADYRPIIKDDQKPTSIWRSFLDSQNYGDFVMDSIGSIRFFIDKIRGVPYTSSKWGGNSISFEHAFGEESKRTGGRQPVQYEAGYLPGGAKSASTTSFLGPHGGSSSGGAGPVGGPPSSPDEPRTGRSTWERFRDGGEGAGVRADGVV